MSMYVLAQRLQHDHSILISHSLSLIHPAVTRNHDLNDLSMTIGREGACKEKGQRMYFAQCLQQQPTDPV